MPEPARHLRALPLLLVLGACTPDRPEPVGPPAGAPRAPAPPAPADRPRLLRLVRPGAVERWSDGEVTLRFERATGRFLFADRPPLRGRTRWSLGTLAPCVGPPLRDPPGGDPGGFRKLVLRDGRPAWRLEFSGTNRCDLSGALTLDGRANRVDPDELAVSGLPWHAGGRERARAILGAEVRSRVLARWDEMEDDERLVLLRFMENDPAPEAGEALAELASRARERREDVQAALARWRARAASPHR